MRLFSLVLLLSCGGASLEVSTELEALRHDVEYDVEDGIARMVVRRALRGVEGELDLEIPLPTAGAIDRFRFGVNDRWYDGELLDAEEARDRYDRLSGLAGEEGWATSGAPPPALLAFETDGLLRLNAHPLSPEDTIEIEYRIAVPTCHAKGRAMIDYPADPLLVLTGPGMVREPYETDDFENACDQFAQLLQDDHVVIELDPIREIFASYAVESLGDRHAARIAIDAPEELVPIPSAPSIVFVLDGSYSRADENLADQLAWAKAYLAWVPDGAVEVVVFRREAERLFDRFVTARDFEDAVRSVPREKLLLGNGSFMEEGIELASSILEGGGEKRIVVFSDLMMRDRFDAEAAAGSLDGSAVLHLVSLGEDREGEPRLDVDSGELAIIAHATGGASFDLSGDPHHEDARAVVEELVHPIRLDDVEVFGLGEVIAADALPRGDTWRMTALLEHAPSDRIEVRAKLWSSEISFERRRSPSVDDAMPAILVATAPLISDDELARVVHKGGVVSRATSYLAELGGVDPIAPPDLKSGWSEIRGTRFSSTCGCCGGWGRTVGIDHAWLRAQVRLAAEACGARTFEASLETTKDEIADVEIRASEGEECLREAIWALRLGEEYRALDRARVRLSSLDLP